MWSALGTQQCLSLSVFTILSCILFLSSLHRLVEIAESRFPQYFNTEEKLLLTSSRVHLCRELTCEGLLQR